LKATQKTIQNVVQPGLCGSNDLCVGRKMAMFLLFLQSREQVIVRQGQNLRIGWMIKTMEAQLSQLIQGCKCPGRRGNVVQEEGPLGDLPAEWRLSFKMSFNCTSRDE
jgi:hypothetical protein